MKIVIALLLLSAAAFAQTKAKSGLTPAGGHQVTLSCSAPTSGGTVTGYNFYRGTAAGGESSTPLNSSPVSTCSFIDTASLVEGQEYFYTAKATGPGGLSGPSNEANATIPFLPPGVPQSLSATAQ